MRFWGFPSRAFLIYTDMIVEIRKVKITRSVFNQLVSPSFENIGDYEVLGWVYEKGKFILLHCKQRGSLCKMRVLSNLRIDPDKASQVLFSLNGMASCKSFQTQDDALRWCSITNTIHSEAKLRGQLYI